MGLIIPNYTSNTGILLEEAYMCPVSVYYDNIQKILNFEIAIYVNKNAYINNLQPIEGSIPGMMSFNYDGTQDLFNIIDTVILNKIAMVEGKTEEECISHNTNEVSYEGNIPNWPLIWDYKFASFAGAYIDINEEEEEEEFE